MTRSGVGIGGKPLSAVLLLAMAASLLLSVPALAHAQFPFPGRSGEFNEDRTPTEEEIISSSYSGPVFQDAFWTDRSTPPAAGESLEKVEVAPGDGASILAVVLLNRGLSEITAISGILDLPSGFRASGGGSSQAVATHSGIVEPGESFTLFFQVDVTDGANVQGYSSSLLAKFSRIVETGQQREASIQVPFRLTGKVILDAEAATGIAPGTAREVPITISNRGSAAATGVVVTVLAVPASADAVEGGLSGSSSAASVGPTTFDVGSIPVDGSAQIRPVIYASNAAGDTLQIINLQVTYSGAYGVKKTQSVPVGLVVLPRALDSELAVAAGENPSSTTITAGKIFDYRFVISNIADRPLSDLLVTLRSQSDELKVLGESKWTLKTIEPGARQEFSTSVFAPIGMIGDSATFNLDVKYLSSGQSRTESVDLGAYVDGEISISAYEVEVNYIGGTPNIVGNLLNEGNTLALFTTVELVSADGLVSDLPPQQYLGDLDENSPLPFSIPIRTSDGAQAGTYPVTLRITYKDNLRELHTLDIDSQVNFVSEPAAGDESGQGAGGMNGAVPAIGIGAVVAAAIAAVVVVRRRKKSALKRSFESRKDEGESIESVLDSHRLEKRSDERK